MSDLKPNYESIKDELQNQYPDLVSGIEKKQAKKSNDLIKKKSKNPEKSLKLEVKKNDEIRLHQVEKKAQKSLSDLSEAKKYQGGRVFGSKNRKTIVKEMAKQEMISYIQKKTAKLIQVQTQLAFGSQAIFLNEHFEDKNGKIKTRKILVEDDEQIEHILNDPNMIQGDNFFIITKIPPDNQAITNLLDRAYNKPKQENENINKEVKAKDVIDELVNDE